MGSVNHHPPEPLIAFLCLTCLANWSPDFRCHILLLLNNVLLTEFHLKGGFAGVGLDCDISPEKWKTI